MPQLNGLGEWCSGIAGVGVYWQGGTIWPAGTGGGAQWFTENEVIGQRTEPGAIGLYAHHIHTRVDRLLFAGPIYEVQGSRYGHWALRTSEGTTSVVRDSFGRYLVGAGLGGRSLGPDGSLVVKRLYHSNGPFDVYEPDGSHWVVSQEDMFDIVNYGNRRVTWRDTQGIWHAVGVPIPQPLAWADWFQYVFVPDEDGGEVIWQSYQMSGAMVLHPRGQSDGYVLQGEGDSFRPDPRVVPQGIQVVWSTQEGDPPHAIRNLVQDLSLPRIDLSIPVVEPFEQPKFVGVIWGSSEQYGYDIYTGNVETLFGAYGQWPASDYTEMAVPGRAVVVSPGALHVPADKNLGRWCDSFEADVQAGVDQKRRFRYTDAREYADRVQPRASDVRLFQCYPRKGETVSHFEAEMNEQVNRFGGQKGIVAKFYEGNPPEDFTEAELEPFFPVFERLLRRPDCLGLLAFNGSRMTSDGTNAGIKKHARWRQWLDALATAAGSTLPAFVPVGQPPQPQPAKRFGGAAYDYLFAS